MARKSKECRLAEGNSLKTMYEDAMLTTSWEYRFLTSVLSQMESGRYPSKRQRDKFDHIVSEGIPEAKGDVNTLAQIDSAIIYWADNEDRTWESTVLRDLRRNVFKGWEFSEKQSSLLSKILLKCGDDKDGKNVYNPSDEERKDLRVLTHLYSGYSGTWQLERPALGKAVDRVVRFLAGECDTIELFHYEKLNKSMGSRLKKFKNPRFKKGDLSQTSQYHSGPNREAVVIFCVSDVYINKTGQLVNDWMVPTVGVNTLNQDTLLKRLIK